MNLGATTSAGRGKKDWERGWELLRGRCGYGEGVGVVLLLSCKVIVRAKSTALIALAVIFSAAAVPRNAFAAPGEKWYSEWWGSDAGLWVNLKTGCGRDLGVNSKCYRFTRINGFAIEADGTLFCDAGKTPVLSKPLSASSKCTSRGWQKVR